MLAVAFGVGFALLAGCDVANSVADDLARDRAKVVVNGVMADKLPGVDVSPVTNCIIDNASAGEILTIASAAATGVTQSTVELVAEITKRPDAVTCIASAGLGLLAL
ncbi:MAG: succinate dehydrogenase [Rhodobacterales bacterium]|nr:MAG: succinate dehydrogenase [Rhodobacterales bacterium]